MIELRTLDGESLDLYPNTSITFVRKNPFFLEELVMISTQSLSFSLPRTENNDRKLQQFAEPSTYLRVARVLYVDVLLAGNLYMKAELNVFRSPMDSYSVSLTRRYVRFRTDMRIREMDIGEITAGSIAENRDDHFGKVAPEVDYVFPQFYNDTKESHAQWPWDFDDPEAQDKIPVNWNGGWLNNATDQEIVIPMFYLSWAVKKVVEMAGNVRARGRFFEEDLIKDKVIFNNTATNADVKLAKLYMPMYSSKAPPLNTVSCTIFIAHKDDPNPTISRHSNLKSIDWYEFVAGTKLEFVFYELTGVNTVVNTYFITYTCSSADAADPAVLISNLGNHIVASVPNTAIALLYGNVNTSVQYVKISMTNGNRPYLVASAEYSPADPLFDTVRIRPADTYTQNDIRPEMHLPDTTVSEFLTNIAHYHNLAVYLDDRKDQLNFVPKKHTLGSDSIDMTPYLLKQYEYEFKEALNLRLEFAQDSSDEAVAHLRKHANNNPEHVIDPITTFEVKAATLAPNQDKANGVDNLGVVDYAIGSMPVTQIPIGSYDDPKAFSLRFLKILGDTLDDKGNHYMGCSNLDLTPNEVYTYWWKDWYQVVKHAGRFFWRNFDLPLEVFLNLDYSKRWQVLDNSYVWEEMRMTVNMKQIEKTEVKMLKL